MSDQESHKKIINEIEIDTLESPLKELTDNFLLYASHAILNQAIPDISSGALPTQKKFVLAAMELGAKSSGKTLKSSILNSFVTGNLSPQGSAYNVLVNMSQRYKVPAMLFQPEGNWGEIENFTPAAERYTETKLSKFAEDVLLSEIPNKLPKADQIPSPIVPYQLTYTNLLQEPEFLPAKIPLLLINGSGGIAVGMAQNFPQLSIIPLLEELKHQILTGEFRYENITLGCPTNPEITSSKEELIETLKSGRGTIKVHSKSEPIIDRGQYSAIMVTSVPPYTKLNDIGDVTNEWIRSDPECPIRDFLNETEGDEIHLRFPFKQSKRPQSEDEYKAILANLLVKCSLTSTISVNMVALKDRFPVEYNVERLLIDWTEIRQETIKRIAEEDLKEIQAKIRRLMIQRVIHDILPEISEDLIHNAENLFSKLQTLFQREGVTSPNEEEHAYILSLNLRQVSSLSLKDNGRQLESLANQAKASMVLILDKSSRLNKIIADIETIIKKLPEYDIKDIRMEHNPSILDSLKVEPKPQKPTDLFPMESGDQEVLAQSSLGSIIRIPSRNLRTTPTRPAFHLSSELISIANHHSNRYLHFLAPNGNPIFIDKNKLPVNEAITGDLLSKLSKRPNGTYTPIYPLSDNPTHLLIIYPKNLVHQAKLIPFEELSPRAQIKHPETPTAAFLVDREQYPQIQPSTYKRTHHLPIIDHIPGTSENGYMISTTEDGTQLFKQSAEVVE